MSEAKFVIRGKGPLKGTVSVPGDKSIGHRSVLFGALAEGRCTVHGLSGGLDNLSTIDIFRSLGVGIELDGTTAVIDGVGLGGLKASEAPLNCGNSGTTMRLMSGLLSGQAFDSTLFGDESLTRRPMRRVIDPLTARGAQLKGVAGSKEEEQYPPLSISACPNEGLQPLEFHSPIASAQVKSAVLLSGLYASGLTAVSEPVISRDHTERMMRSLGVPLQTMGSMVLLDPSDWQRRWAPFEWVVPGDLSSAAFLLCAAAMVPGSEIAIDGVGLNPTRTGLLDMLRAMRAALRIIPRAEGAGGEPTGRLEMHHGPLASGKVGGELLTRMIDEVPSLCALAATHPGRTEIRDAEELRVKESDRISASAGVLRAFGVDVTELPDGLVIQGGERIEGTQVHSRGDHRIAMMGALLGLVAEGETIVEDVDCVATSFPNFVTLLQQLGADIRLES